MPPESRPGPAGDGESGDGIPTPLFPVFLKLAGRRVVLVGGGRVAAAKLPALFACGARVTVVAPRICPEADWGDAALVRREFTAGDLDGAWFAVAAAPPRVNREVASAAGARGVFVNVVDDPDQASAYAGGVLRRGGLTIAISTEGQAPALAGLLREGLAALLPEEVGTWITRATALRREQKATGVALSQRRPQLLEALNHLYAGRAGAVQSGGGGEP